MKGSVPGIILSLNFAFLNPPLPHCGQTSPLFAVMGIVLGGSGDVLQKKANITARVFFIVDKTF